MQVLVTIILVAQKQPQALRKPVGMVYSSKTVDLKKQSQPKRLLAQRVRLVWASEVKVAQLCLTLQDPICGILQARILE